MGSEMCIRDRTTSGGYSITSSGVSCRDKGMSELNDESECISAAPKIQNLVPNATYGGNLTMANRPPGCFYHSNELFWNKDKNGTTCYGCKSVCKGSMIKSS